MSTIVTTKNAKGIKIITIYTKPFIANGKSYRGRQLNGKVSLNQTENKLCLELIKMGLSHEAIAKQLKLTISQVQRRASMANISVMNWRRGTSEEAKQLLNRYTVVYK